MPYTPIVATLGYVLSPDGNTIGVMYMRMDPTGKKTTNVTFATYEKMP
jgi:hypothetical protein